MKHTEYAQQLVAMIEKDQATLGELFEKGEIGPHQPYHPVLKALHQSHKEALGAIIEDIGWPTISSVGQKASEAAWLVAQHAVLDTEFMSRCADLMEIELANDDIEGWQLAFLRDRILTMSDQPQIYGTQFDEDEEGWPVPFPILDPETVNERRRSLGLNTLEERTVEMRERETARRAAVAKAEYRD
ncbi:MAG: DUF6624 domain-containing protein [Pseudomonadota bacterium]